MIMYQNEEYYRTISENQYQQIQEQAAEIRRLREERAALGEMVYKFIKDRIMKDLVVEVRSHPSRAEIVERKS